jgi:predicted RNase H-like nuclease (RuvC/YqgF family)
MRIQIPYAKSFNDAVNRQRQETELKIHRMEAIIEEYKKELFELNSTISKQQQSQSILQCQLDSINADNEKLIEQINVLQNESDNCMSIIESFKQEQIDLIENNKTIQKQNEQLNKEIEDKSKAIKKQKDECFYIDKVKYQYEESIINLAKHNEALKAKNVSLENIISQKDRYIQMLLNERAVLTPIHNINKNGQRRPSTGSVRSINSVKDQLSEKDMMIKKLENKIKQLESDNSNLVLRLRNKK